MRVSELAKELGYRAAELVEMAKDRGLPLKTVRDNVDARAAAAVRAQVPHRSKLGGDLKNLYEKIKADLAEAKAAEMAAKKMAPPRVRKKAKPAAEKEPEKKKPAEKPKPVPKSKTVRKKNVVEEFRLGGEAAATVEAPRVLPKIHVTRTEEEKLEIQKASSKPLIDVDKIIGKERVVRVMRTAEIDQDERTKAQQEKEKKARAASEGAPPTARVVRPERPRGRRVKAPPIAKPTVSVPKPRPVSIPPSEREHTVRVPIRLKDFSKQVGVKFNDILRKLVGMGQIAGINAVLDEETVVTLAEEFKRKVTITRQQKAEEQVLEGEKEESRPEDQADRSPVVTFLGHVDHGKTSLLDKIRNTDVTAGEAGGITQHIGASIVEGKDGKKIVFLDTPGHQAFTAMRARGAKATDLVVLVVAADDGVMPQTEEAYNHAKAAGAPTLIAINKIDKNNANPNKVKGQLASLGLQTEDWGGKTTCVEVSALTGLNMDQLLEMISLEAEILELKANPKLRARGVVLEARKTEDRGVVATVLVQDGTLRRGDILLAGRALGRVRSMHDDRRRSLDEAGPSTPVEVAGLDQVPDAGEKFQVVVELTQARAVVEERRRKEREEAHLQQASHVTLEGLFSQIESGERKEVRVIIRADTSGSAEVLRESFADLSTKEVKLTILHVAVGAVNESDILLADASDALIVGFHVSLEDRALHLAKEKGVDVRLYKVIYEAIEEIKAALEGLLEPDKVPHTIGHLAVKEVFRISRIGAIAGCLVTDGKVARSSKIRVNRNGKVIHEGGLESLKRFKDDVREVAEGYECGVKIAGHDDLKPGDVIEVYEIREVARKLENK